MKKRVLLICLILAFAVEIIALVGFAVQDPDNSQDAVAVNEAVQSVQRDWNSMENHKNHTSLDYVVIDRNGRVVFQTKPGLSESINMAVIHRDTILDIQSDGSVEGKIIIWNNGAQTLQSQKRTAVMVLAAAILIQCGICVGYVLYLDRVVIKPFQDLKGFAERIAGGNLDIPLEMDRHNLFGVFTESFDIMRAELKKARAAEAEANASKKELVAKLSHDIKTPVASIKAVSEVGMALAEDDKMRNNYTQIIRKADQINTLITNLFTATLEELRQLTVTPTDIESRELKTLFENSDYLGRAFIPDVPDCLLYADKLRLQQVFDNIFANSYKYANTKIDVAICKNSRSLSVCMEDHGGGVSREELPLLKEKFKRGSNVKDMEGAGLGLYISDYFMKEMGGGLVVENGQNGLKVTVTIALSGTI
ncbi:ATP-binding protein [Ruminococcus sp. 5_1_39BFAA]|uniref:HAMP domain-containing sensor histidine kinase n=1 Tax=Ruminococcus sp. 5_1_39BFAA TaxID=457412 RepID=UPI003569940F